MAQRYQRSIDGVLGLKLLIIAVTRSDAFLRP
jgi:hypothetical protein